MTEPIRHSPVAIVTGASRGIGLAVARQLSAKNYRVALIARSKEKLAEAVSGLSNAVTLVADVGNGSQVANQIVEQVRERFGRIDALVNNAGYAPLLSLEQTTDEIWREAIDVNLSAAFWLTRSCWAEFKKQGGGVVVNISSAAARDPFPGFIAYGAAKAALNNLTLSLAREGAKDSIRVHCVAPGATETEMFRNLPGMSEFPKASTMDPADVARIVVSCVTGELAHTSGEVIYLHKSV
jgi:NAD(P)-dependent dehydrogenase (short-subunit alcohol dehydrogenase family)